MKIKTRNETFATTNRKKKLFFTCISYIFICLQILIIPTLLHYIGAYNTDLKSVPKFWSYGKLVKL